MPKSTIPLSRRHKRTQRSLAIKRLLNRRKSNIDENDLPESNHQPKGILEGLTKNRHDAWMEALGRNPNIEHMSPSNAVCSEHFAEEEIIFTNKCLQLKPNAVPTLKLRRQKGSLVENQGYLNRQKDKTFCFSYTQSNQKSQNGSSQSPEHHNKYRFAVETMSRDNIRDQVLDLMNQKEKIENDIKNLTSILTQNRVGMNDPLVDNEGFPIASIDIHQVRYARHHIIRLQNDHKNLMKQIENGLHEFHSNASAVGTCQAIPMSVDVPNLVVHKTPFAKVTVVSEGSPADYAGMSANDEIVEFGSVNVGNFKNITDIATVVQHAVGVQVNVKLKRGDRFLTVQLVPRTWQGRGLLGCNIVAL